MSIIFLPRRAFQAAGCLYGGYWALFFGIVAFLIINSYLREHRHHPFPSLEAVSEKQASYRSMAVSKSLVMIGTLVLSTFIRS